MDHTAQPVDLHEFVRNAGPDGWMDYADELKDAADLLWSRANTGRTVGLRGDDIQGVTKRTDKPSISRTYILLSGLALENLLKGIAVSLDPSLVNKGELDNRLKTHRLLDIVELCDSLELSAEEIELCRIAQEAIPYWGRYPIPRSYHSIKSEHVATFEYQATFDSLYGRLHEHLYLSIRDGWDSGIDEIKLTSLRLSQYEPAMQASIERINKLGTEDA